MPLDSEGRQAIRHHQCKISGLGRSASASCAATLSGADSAATPARTSPLRAGVAFASKRAGPRMRSAPFRCCAKKPCDATAHRKSVIQGERI